MNELTTLIAKAINESPKFKAKLSYWVNIRNKQPDKDWLYTQLLEVYGSYEELSLQLEAIKETT